MWFLILNFAPIHDESDNANVVLDVVLLESGGMIGDDCAAMKHSRTSFWSV